MPAGAVQAVLQIPGNSSARRPVATGRLAWLPELYLYHGFAEPPETFLFSLLQSVAFSSFPFFRDLCWGLRHRNARLVPIGLLRTSVALISATPVRHPTPGIR